MYTESLSVIVSGLALLWIVGISRCGKTAGQVDIVANGIPLNAITRGVWEQEKEAISSSGLYNELYALKYIEDEDFHLRVRLSLEQVDTSTALFFLFDNHFGFDSSPQGPDTEGRLFLYSSVLGQVKRYGRSRDYINPGVPFLFEIIREGDRFSMRIDGREAAVVEAAELTPPLEGIVGIRPWINTMRIFDFSIAGRFSDLPELDFVFSKGEAGYVCVRIPAIVKTNSGTLLAFAEARKDNCYTDSGDIDLVLKRSEDGGKSWSPLQIIWDDGKNSCGSPAPVVDRSTGKIFLLASHNLGEDNVAKVLENTSQGPRRVFVFESDDDGKTWSSPREITSRVMGPGVLWVGTGPGAGIQLERPPYTGRLLVSAYYLVANPESHYAFSIYSDDHGESWEIGNGTPKEGVNEGKVAELPDGTLILNMRNEDREASRRQVAISRDGGSNWTEQRVDSFLIEPICQAALLYVQTPGSDSGLLLFSNPSDSVKRVNLMLRASPDQGKSWPLSRMIFPGPSAYSDLLFLDRDYIGCLFECGNIWPYEGIRFEKIPLSLLQYD